MNSISHGASHARRRAFLSYWVSKCNSQFDDTCRAYTADSPGGRCDEFYFRTLKSNNSRLGHRIDVLPDGLPSFRQAHRSSCVSLLASDPRRTYTTPRSRIYGATELDARCISCDIKYRIHSKSDDIRVS